MNRSLLILFTLILTLPLLSTAAIAQTRYVSDVLYVPLRSGMGNQYRIVHQGLASGSRLELLRQEETEDGESWSLVRTPEGEEGWMRSQFLLDEPTASLKLGQAQQRAERLAEQNQSLEEELASAQERADELENTLEEVRQNHAELENEHGELKEVSSEAVDLHEEHQALSERYQMLQTQYEVIQADNERLKKDRRYQEWLFGGGILLAGVILSLILQAIGKRRRQSEWR